MRIKTGCPLSPFLFLIIVEALSRVLKEAKRSGVLRGIKVTDSEEISHFLFMDDIFCSIFGSVRDAKSLKDNLDLFYKATEFL
jgi:hypothetical protein